MTKRLCQAIGLLTLVCSLSAAAQSRSAVLVGVITGAGKPLAGSHLRLVRGQQSKEEQNARETVTNADGSFSFVGVEWGAYSLEVTADGWQARRVRLDLRSNATMRAMVELEPSAAGDPTSTKQLRPKIRALDEDVWWGSERTELSTEKLPNGRQLWAILEHQEPSVVMDPIDIGGLAIGTPMLFSSNGISWTENQYRLNGFNVTDPYIAGLPMLWPDLDAESEFQVVRASKPAFFAGSGVDISLETPQGTDAMHGALRLFDSPHSLQSSNFDARLRKFGFPGGERLNHLVDGSAQLGGRLLPGSNQLPFFAAFSTQQLSKSLGGFFTPASAEGALAGGPVSAPIDVHLYRGMLDFSPLKTSSHQLNLLYNGQHLTNSREFVQLATEGELPFGIEAFPLIAPSATTRGNDDFHQWQSQWDQPLGRATVFTAGFGVSNAILDSALQNGVQGVSTIDLASLARTGPAPLALAGTHTRYEGRVLAQTILRRPAGSHSLSFGLDWDRSDISNRWDSRGGLQQVLVGGVGTEVVRWNTPAHAREHVQNIAEFIQDSWRPTSWLALPVGLRVNTSTGSAVGPAHGISWTTLEPRLGAVMPIGHTGLVLRASWSRYGHVLQGRYLDYGNPNALGGQILRWTDANGDGIAQPGEIGPLLQTFGGPYSGVNSGLRRPFTDELSFGAEKHIGAGFVVAVRFFRRDDHRLLAIDNLGVPFSAYTPQSIPDPGFDPVVETPDQRFLTLYNRIPSALGQDFLVLANRFHSGYKGFEVSVTKQLRRNWEFSASYTAGRTLAFGGPGNQPFENDTGYLWKLATDPNTLFNAQARSAFDRSYTGKLAAYYAAPHGFQLAAVASYYDGYPYGRLLLVNGFNQGPFLVRATPVSHPGGYQTQMNTTLDVRLARDFHLRRGVISGFADVFNLLNVNSNTRELDLTGPALNQRVPIAVEPPRSTRLGVQWKF